MKRNIASKDSSVRDSISNTTSSIFPFALFLSFLGDSGVGESVA
jgi:hypothetical protein